MGDLYARMRMRSAHHDSAEKLRSCCRDGRRAAMARFEALIWDSQIPVFEIPKRGLTVDMSGLAIIVGGESALVPFREVRATFCRGLD